MVRAVDEERRSAFLREADERAADGAALIVAGLVWLAVDLAERPALPDVGWFLAIGLVAFVVFAVMRLRLLRRVARAASRGELAAAPPDATVLSRREVVRGALRTPVVLVVAYLVVAWWVGGDFREDTLDALAGIVVGVGGAALLEAKRLRRVEATAGGHILRARRSSLGSARVYDYYVAS